MFSEATHAAKKKSEEQADAEAKRLLAAEGEGVLTDATKRAFERANANTTSAWLTVCPSEDHGTRLTRHKFLDGVAIRYGWEPLEAAPFCSCFEVQRPGAARTRERLTMARF